MGRRRRAGMAALFVAFLVAAPGLTAAGTPEEVERVIFELTLSGDVNAEDSFLLDHNICDDIAACGLPTFCSPTGPSELVSGKCGLGTFRFTLEVEAGVTVDYALLRTTGSSSPDLSSPLLADSVTVRDGGITISLGYIYPSAGPALPDTALPAPSD